MTRKSNQKEMGEQGQLFSFNYSLPTRSSCCVAGTGASQAIGRVVLRVRPNRGGLPQERQAAHVVRLFVRWARLDE
jgi:hypothetical protein